MRERRRTSRPEDQPVFTKPVDMDFERRRIVAPFGFPSSTIEASLRWQIYYLCGIDGGDIGEPTPAMDYMLQNLDGGAL